MAISTYLHISKQLKEHGALTPQEQQIVMLAVSEANGCGYCVAAHSMVAGTTQVPAETVEQLRRGERPSDPKQAALVRFALASLENLGWIPEPEQEAFSAAGYTSRHALDVLGILALKPLSNYTNHLAKTPLDTAFEEHRWNKVD